MDKLIISLLAFIFCETQQSPDGEIKSVINRLQVGESYQIMIRSAGCYNGSILRINISRDECGHLLAGKLNYTGKFMRLYQKKDSVVYEQFYLSAEQIDSVKRFENSIISQQLSVRTLPCRSSTYTSLLFGNEKYEISDAGCYSSIRWPLKLTEAATEVSSTSIYSVYLSTNCFFSSP